MADEGGGGSERARQLWAFVRECVSMGIFANVLNVKQAVCQQIALSHVLQAEARDHDDDGDEDERHWKQQGDVELYSIENMMRRRALKLNPKVRGAIDDFWRIVDIIKDDNDAIVRDAYITLSGSGRLVKMRWHCAGHRCHYEDLLDPARVIGGGSPKL